MFLAPNNNHDAVNNRQSRAQMRVLIWHTETGELLDDFSFIPSVADLWHRRDMPIRIEFKEVATLA